MDEKQLEQIVREIFNLGYMRGCSPLRNLTKKEEDKIISKLVEKFYVQVK